MLLREKYKTADIYNELRDRAFNVKPDEIGIKENAENQIYGMIMEIGYEEGVASLVCMGDGSISLYFSGGTAIIGVGQDKTACDLGLRCISIAQEFICYAKEVKGFDLPRCGYTRFYFLTFNGSYMCEEKEDILGNGDSELSILFYAAQEVITQARLLAKKQQESYKH